MAAPCAESLVRAELARLGQRFESAQKRRRLADLCAETAAEYDAEMEAAAAEFWQAGDLLADLLLLLLRYGVRHRPAQLAAALAAAGLTADVRAVAEALVALEDRVKALEAGRR